MDIRETVAASLAATAKSNEQKCLAGQLARQARQAISDRALTLAEGAPLLKGEAIVSEWHDDSNRLHRVLVSTTNTVMAITYMGERPSGRLRTVHRLSALPLEHLEEHFGPLMRADYAATTNI